jgi:hypothetical protein
MGCTVVHYKQVFLIRDLFLLANVSYIWNDHCLKEEFDSVFNRPVVCCVVDVATIWNSELGMTAVSFALIKELNGEDFSPECTVYQQLCL